MSERLKKLKHQKQLLEEHLQWLEAEIVAESGPVQVLETPPTESKATVSAKTPAVAMTVPQIREESPPASDAACEEASDPDLEELSDQLISQYSHETIHREMDPRLGLLLYFGGALGLISLVVFLFYWFGYR